MVKKEIFESLRLPLASVLIEFQKIILTIYCVFRMVSLKGSLCSQGFYHKPFEARLIAAVHRAGIVGIGLVILLFHVVKIVHYLHHLVFGAVMLLQRRTKKAVGLGMTGITLLDMLD